MIRMVAFVAGCIAAVAISTAGRIGIREAGVTSPGAFPSAMVGTWSGDSRICVNWTVQRILPVRLTIAADGSVTGTIGDAALRSGRLQVNRNSLERALHWKTDWIVVGHLDGDVIKAEGIHRAGVKVPLDWVDDHFQGGVNTSGGMFGGKQSMWLAAQDLRLERQHP